jgi:hypothetical protein
MHLRKARFPVSPFERGRPAGAESVVNTKISRRRIEVIERIDR